MNSTFGTEPRFLVRTKDPDTSFDAAEAVNTTALEQLVYEEIKVCGAAGVIMDTILARFPTLPYSSITARPKALIDRGLVVDTGRRLPGRSGRSQRVLMASCWLIEPSGQFSMLLNS